MIIGISGKKGAGKDLTADLINEILQERNSIQFIRKKFADKLKDIVCLILGCTREQLEDREFKEKELGPEWSKWRIMEKESFGKQVDTVSRYLFSSQPFYSSEEEAIRNTPKNKLTDWRDTTYFVEEIKLTPRLLLQLLGTECGKEIIHPRIWVNSLMSDYKEIWNDPNPIEGNDYKINSLEIMSDDVYRITYNEGQSEAEVYKEEIFTLDWLITDVRFPDEVGIIKQKQGIVIRINRHFDIIRYEEAVKEFHKGSPVFILYPDGSEALIEDLDTLDYYLKDSSVKFGFERNFDTHKSETSLDDYKDFDYVIENNGSIEDLKAKLENILVELKLI